MEFINDTSGAYIDGGPGNTNNVTVADIQGTTSGELLQLTFPTNEILFGFGYALLATGAVPNATTISLFEASNLLLGSLSYSAISDPIFSGGFAGIQSDTPFTRAVVTFGRASNFAFDNVRFESASVPEPATLALFGAGLAGLGALRRHRKPKALTE